MKAIISFSEIQELVGQMAGQQVGLEYVAEDTVKITAMVKVKIIKVPVPLELRVVEVQDNCVRLQYSGKMGVDLMVSGVLKFIKATKPEWVNVIDLQGDRTVAVQLNQIEKLAPVLEKVSLQAVSFGQGDAVVELRRNMIELK